MSTVTEGPVKVPHLATQAPFGVSKFFIFFVISGFCGLVYEVIWLRLAMASFGVTTALTSIVLSMFMAGLGVGSWGVGALARRYLDGKGRRALRFYALAELFIAFSSFAVPLQLRLGRQVLLQLATLAYWETSRYYILAGLWIGITLLPWCACMGSTFPLLMAVIRQTRWPNAQRSFSYLYVANVIGAFTGTMLSAFVLIELLGFKKTLYVAGLLNFTLALLAFATSLEIPSLQSDQKLSSEPTQCRRLYGLNASTILVLLFTTGLVSMGMEVVWIRQFTPYQGTVVYAFAAILGVYLLATIAGSQYYYRRWARFKMPRQSAYLWCLLGLAGVLPVGAADPRLALSLNAPWPLSGFLRISSIAFFCCLAGFLTPLLVDSWSSGDPDRAGKAYAVNIAGCIFGPLVAGFWLLPWVGSRDAILLLSAPLFVLAAVITICGRKADPESPILRVKLTVIFAVAIAAAILLFRSSRDYETMYPVREVRRDYAATVIATGEGFERKLLVNGIGMTNLTPITKYMAHLPLAFMSRQPRNGLVICFGMGTSFRSMLSWGIPATAVDLVPSVPAFFPYYHEDAPRLLNSGLARIVIDDGRRYLDGSHEKYDVIVVDPPPPLQAAGSSLLYSRDFYAVVKQHLSGDGILQMWVPVTHGAALVAIAKAMVESFPYVRGFTSFDGVGIHFLASEKPLPAFSSSVLAARLPPAAARDFLDWGPKKDVEGQFNTVLVREVKIKDIVKEAPLVPVIDDDHPVNEYYLLRTWIGIDR